MRRDRSRPVTKEYAEGYDRIFDKPRRERAERERQMHDELLRRWRTTVNRFGFPRFR